MRRSLQRRNEGATTAGCSSLGDAMQTQNGVKKNISWDHVSMTAVFAKYIITIIVIWLLNRLSLCLTAISGGGAHFRILPRAPSSYVTPLVLFNNTRSDRQNLMNWLISTNRHTFHPLRRTFRLRIRSLYTWQCCYHPVHTCHIRSDKLQHQPAGMSLTCYLNGSDEIKLQRNGLGVNFDDEIAANNDDNWAELG